MARMVKSSAFHHGGRGLVSGPCGIYGEESGTGTQSCLSTLGFPFPLPLYQCYIFIFCLLSTLYNLGSKQFC